MLFCATIFAQQPVTVSGTVTEGTSGDPAIGVTVLVKGTNLGTVTDIDGKYLLNNVPAEATLVFSYIGMLTVEEPLNGRTTVDMVMHEDVQALDEVVVIGYGTAKKRDLTGSIVSVSADQIADRPSANPLASLQGKVAGVQIVNTGRAGQDPEIRIRGTNSINGYKPLYIVDGLFSDNIGHINPSDVESMEILKDPSSLAIFGVRGANGVIIITTKKAKMGQTIVNLNSSFGVKEIYDRVDLTTAAQFRELYDEQRRNQGAQPYDYTRWNADTDWQDEMFRSAFITNNNISITGSTERSRFYMGLGYTGEEGSIQTEKFSKITVNLNSEYNVTDYLKFGFQVNGAKSKTPDAKGVGSIVRAAPIAPVFYDYTDPATGKTERLLHTMPDFQRAQLWNPLVETFIRGNHNLGVNHRVAGNIYGEVKFLEHFTYRTTLSLDFAINEARAFSPVVYFYNPDIPGKENAQDRQSVSQLKSTEYAAQGDHILTYQDTFDDLHSLTVMGGITTNYREFSLLEGDRSELLDKIYFSVPNDNQDKWWLTSLNADGARNQYDSNKNHQWRRFTMSYLLRALYSYDNRYLLNGSFRRDGSSVFRGVGNTWENFYSFGTAWVVSEEEFMKGQHLIDYLKLKGSWGVLGTENTGTSLYPTYPELTSVGSAVFGPNENIIPGYTKIYNVQDLKWEKTYSWEAGAEIALFNQRLRVEPVYYNKRTKDIIVLLDSRGGAFNSLENLGDIENKGLELTASWSDKIGESDFSYSVGVNLTTINNKVISLGRDEGDAIYEGMARTVAGYPIAYFYGYRVKGVYQNNEDINQSEPNTLFAVKPGDLKFEDVNGDGVIDQDDRTMIGKPTPDYTYGLNINLAYKGFDLGVDMMGVYGNEIYRDWDTSSFAQFNYLTKRMKRWNGEGTSNWEPILDPGRAINRTYSSYYIEDGSFFRLRNIQLGYTLPKSLLERIHMKSLRIYTNVQNLKSWHKNSGYTPEIGGSAVRSGVDEGTYPMPAIYTFGLNLTF
ncbi:MAG: SusC/RagA family TonB-linked outer membrane protein [Petrimonas mucosa]|uniref:SusC/RagA family TonB-linked outer membrane protein n=1 Tax=Petrimonas mucosa TaxID=1642646 RepID=UPI003D8E82A5